MYTLGCIFKSLPIKVLSMKIQVTNTDWATKKLPIKNKTMRTLKNGRLVPTALCMYRQANKI